MSSPPDDDNRLSSFARGSQRLMPTLDPVDQGRRSLDLIDAIFDGASEEAEREGPVDAGARRLAAMAQRLAAEGRQRAEARSRLAAGTDGPDDGAQRAVAVGGDPDTAQIRRLDRGGLEVLVIQLQRRRGDVPSVTFEGINEAELVEWARSLRSR